MKKSTINNYLVCLFKLLYLILFGLNFVFLKLKSKIKKRSWVLHECLERVPLDIDTAKFLIDFGLHGTDIDAIQAIKDKDDNLLV